MKLLTLTLATLLLAAPAQAYESPGKPPRIHVVKTSQGKPADAYPHGYSKQLHPRDYYTLPYWSTTRTRPDPSPACQARTSLYRKSHPRNHDLTSLEADVQSSLRELGFYRGPVDGEIGESSRAAIRAFQLKHRCNVTGRIDSTLLRALDI